MDRGYWQATVRGVAKESDMTGHCFCQSPVLILVKFGELQQNSGVMGKAELRRLEYRRAQWSMF